MKIHKSNDSKICEICKQKFFRKYYIRNQSWLLTKYCSLECSAKAKIKYVKYRCDFCFQETQERPSHFNKTKRHFCSRKCYSFYQRYLLTKEEHSAYGKGYSKEEKSKRIKARAILNHAIRDGKITRLPCEICGLKKSEAHHINYDNPLKVKWLCFKHHREAHKAI